MADAEQAFKKNETVFSFFKILEWKENILCISFSEDGGVEAISLFLRSLGIVGGKLF